MMEAVQVDFLPLITEAEHPQYLLNGKPAGMNACGVFTENVLEFREGKLTGPYVEVQLCADGDFILYEFSYMTKIYGCGHPLSRPCHECHRGNTSQFLADDIYNVFKICTASTTTALNIRSARKLKLTTSTLCTTLSAPAVSTFSAHVRKRKNY